MSSVLYRFENNVGYITLNEPKRSNALSNSIKQELTAILREVRGDYSVRALVIEAEGKNFCAGGDIATMGDKQTHNDGRERMRMAVDWLKELVSIEKPTIAAVNGAAAGGGLSLALACDFIIAADNAKFCCSFINISLVADMGSLYFLPRRVGMATAKNLAYTGRNVDGQEALEIGLADKVVASGDLKTATQEMAEKLAAGPTYSIGMTKTLINKSFETEFNTFADMEINFQAAAFHTVDHHAAVKAFFEKKPPIFIGK